MGLTFPRDLGFDVYLGRWVDVTALAERRSLRQEDPVTVTWGLPNEQARSLAPPSTVEGVLNNQGGHWTPGNPMSDYFDYLQGRNVPTRLPLRASRDAFGRTVAGNWTVTDTGDGWNHAGVNDSYSVGSGTGRHRLSAASSFAISYLGDSYDDARVTADCGVLPFITVTGGPVEPCNLVLRYQASGAFAGEHYILRVEIRTDNSVWISIHHSSLGALNTPVSLTALTGLAHVGDNRIVSSFQAEGQTLRGKAWDLATDEPLGWHTAVHHERLATGRVGIRSGVAAGNSNSKPIDFEYDNFRLDLLRHSGELTSLQPSWDVTHLVKKAAFKCADITQRLGRPQRPSLSSAPRRYLAANAEFTTTDHWPLDESSTAPAQGLSATGGAPALFLRETGVVPNRGAVTWGEEDNRHPAVPAFATLSNGGRLVFATQQGALGTAWSVMWAMRLSPDAGAQVFLSTAGVNNRFLLTFYTDGTYELFTNPSGTSLATGTLYPSGVDGTWVTFGLTTFNNGGSAVGFHLNVNGNTLGVGSTTGDGAHSPLSQILIHAPQPTAGGQGASAFSTVFVTSTRFDTVVSGKSIGYRAHWAIMGWRGETAGLRAYRLTAEEGVLFDYWDDLGQTRTMGPQRPRPLLDLLTECAELDGALLYAPRYTPGIGFRGRRAMSGRSADATLDYAAGHVVAPFIPASDDRPTANLVRAERVGGGFLIVEQVTGPMNTADPGTNAEAAGRVPADAKVNSESDVQLGDVGGWVRALGTVPEVRFPKVTVNLRVAPMVNSSAARAMLNLHPGDRLLVVGLSAADVYRDLDQIVRGGKEVFSTVYGHVVTLNTSPYEKYRSGTYGGAEVRYDGAVTTLDAQLTAGSTGAVNVTTTAGQVWTTAAGAFPMDVLVGGSRVTLSGITGAGAAQVMTISAWAAGSALRNWPAGTRVYLYQPTYYC